MKKIKLCHKPTPIDIFFEKSLGFKIHVKRDDLNGLLESGNKIRKLEYLIGDALEKNSDTIITAGNIQSNHCRATMYVCAKLGLKGVAFLKSEETKKEIQGNLLLDHLFDAEIHFLSSDEYENKEEFINKLSADLKKKGRKPYYIPVGGSNEIGMLGYRDAFFEMADYLNTNNIDGIFCAVGSGGTYAGLLLGRYLTNHRVPIYGIIVDESVDFFRNKIIKILEDREKIIKRKVGLKEEDIKLIDGYIGEGYAIPYPEEIEIIKEWAKRGIIFDPVYTAKAFYGMLKEIPKLGVKNPLFIHTGGIFSIFAYNSQLSPK